VFITFLGVPESIVTVDIDGHIFFWEYELSAFKLKSKIFRPKTTYKVFNLVI
jgi:hypothetical protein